MKGDPDFLPDICPQYKHMKRLLLLLLSLPLQLFANSDDSVYMYVAAKSGLTLRETPATTGKVIGKINYGERVLIHEYVPGVPAFVVDGFRSYWVKVAATGKTGYLADAFLFSIPPPAAGTKTFKQYLDQLSLVSCVVKYGNHDENAEESYNARTKTLFKNGAEIYDGVGYESVSTTYVLPQVSIQQAFQLLRLIPQYAMFVKADTPLPRMDSKTATTSVHVTNSKDCLPGAFCLEGISFYTEGDGITEMKIFTVNDEVYIVFETGV